MPRVELAPNLLLVDSWTPEECNDADVFVNTHFGPIGFPLGPLMVRYSVEGDVPGDTIVARRIVSMVDAFIKHNKRVVMFGPLARTLAARVLMKRGHSVNDSINKVGSAILSEGAVSWLREEAGEGGVRVD